MKMSSEQQQHLELDLGDDGQNHNTKRRCVLFSTVLAGTFLVALLTRTSDQNSRVGTSAVQLKQTKTNTTIKQHQNKSLPHLIIHVGPPKTATTSLQCEFGKNAALLDELTPYRYLGKWNVEGCKASKKYLNYSTESIFSNSDDEEELLKGFMSHQKDSKIPIFSKEGLGRSFLQAPKPGTEGKVAKTIQSMKKRGYETKIVASYRRYFEWVPSYYQQRVLNLGKNDLAKSRKSFMELSLCLGSFESYLDHIDECRDSLPIHSLESHPVQMLQKAVEDMFHEEIDIFNSLFHIESANDAENHMLAIFASQMLEQSHDFQKELISGRATLMSPLHTSENQREEVECIHLAVQIYERNLVPDRVRPSSLQKFLITHHDTILKLFYQNVDQSNSTHTAFPEICLSESWQNQLLELSLKFEREIFPEWFRNQEVKHRDAFRKYSEKGKYCQWDGNKILDNAEVSEYILNSFNKH